MGGQVAQVHPVGRLCANRAGLGRANRAGLGLANRAGLGLANRAEGLQLRW